MQPLLDGDEEGPEDALSYPIRDQFLGFDNQAGVVPPPAPPLCFVMSPKRLCSLWHREILPGLSQGFTGAGLCVFESNAKMY